MLSILRHNALYIFILSICATCIMLFPTSPWACSIPVYQYALAYWPSEPYQVIVFHRGPLSPGEQTLVDRLQGTRANVSVKTVDLSDSPDAIKQPSWMVVKYPESSGISEDIWSGCFNAANVESLLNSPIRKEFVRRILKGETAVWVFLESGIRHQDDAAASLLDAQLKRLSENLKISVPEETAVQFNEKDLSVAFSMVRLSRNDPAERIFLQMLLHSELDLQNASKPMAFPVYGRGRALYALVGDGINESNIEELCSFLIGWCSCQVKQQNPGVDLLVSASWPDVMDGGQYTETQVLLKPLMFTESTGTIITSNKNSSNLKRNIIIVVLIQVIGVAIVTFALLWRKKLTR